MINLQKFLVIVDPTVERDYVVERAKMLAKICNAKVQLFINNSNTLSERNFSYEGVDGDFFAIQKKLFEEHYQKILNDLVTEFGEESIEVAAEFATGHNLAEAIITKVNDTKPDLVLKSTHHHGALERILVTNTDWRLIRKCPAPLMLVKPNEWKINGSVVTAVDPMHAKAEQSKLDSLLLSLTEALSQQLHLTPHAFHSYFPFVSSLFPMGGESEEYLSRIRHQHEEKLQELLAEHSFDAENIHLSQGELVPAIIDYLNRSEANLLVIGSLSRNALERAIIGNTAEKILENCPCDVLVAKNT